MTPDELARHIPPEVEEAAARAIATMEGVPELWKLRLVRARAALAAGLANWPGLRDSTHVSFDGLSEKAFILPVFAEIAND